MNVSKADQKRLIGSYLKRLGFLKRDHQFGSEHLVDGESFRAMVVLTEQAEKEMRRYRPASVGCGISKPVAVDLFAVQYLMRFRSGAFKKPDASDYGHLQPAIWRAWQVWDSWKKELRAEFKPAEARLFLDSVSYAELMAT